MKALLIAEKPSLARDIESVYRKMKYPDEITFIALRGHILELKTPEEYSEAWGKPWKLDVLPMIPEKFEYNVKIKDVYKEVKDQITSGKYDYIINACDAGREGELIFYSVYKHIGKKIPVKRFWASDTTPTTIEKALNNLIDDKDSSLTALKASSQFRAYFDWLLGMNLSRAITLKTGTLIPCGRVMTPTLGIVVQRELEIRNFKPVNFWEVEADFDKYKGLWFDKDTNETKFLDKAKAEEFVSKLAKEGKVEAIEQKKETEYAPTLHSLLELQKEANKAYGYTADKTLAIAQVLYEKKKLLTYPRTESRYLPKNLAEMIPKHLKCLEDIPEVSKFVAKILGDKKRIAETASNKKYVDDKKVTDHHAIIPTNMQPKLAELSKEELNIYMLVVKRFLSIFLDPYVTNKTTIITDVDGEKFKTTGKTLVDLGYRAIYNVKDDKDDIIPNVKKGESVSVKEVNLIEKQTTPPSRYNDATLLQAMQNAGRFIEDEKLQNVLKESAGLGTSATRANIIKKLVDRKMLDRKGKSIIPTDFGIKIIEILDGQDIISPELTAVWENKLAEIEAEKYDIKAFYIEMIEYAKTTTKKFIDEITTTLSNNSKFEVIGQCPKCNSDVIMGKQYYLCKNYKNEDTSKECDLIIPKKFNGANISKTEVKKILGGKESKELEFTWKSGKKGKGKLKIEDGSLKIVFGNEGSKSSNSTSNKEKKVVGKCPKCNGNVVEVNYYLCENYKNSCDFILSKSIRGANIAIEDAEKLLKGEETKELKFTWASGKKGKAKLKLNGNKLDFIF